MSRSSAKGQVEPLAALAAVFALCVGLSLYVGVYGSVSPTAEREVAPTALDRFVTEATTFAVLVPPFDAAAAAARPTNYALNATVRSENETWGAGPTPPTDAERAERSVSVRVEPGGVRPGRVEVTVWPAA